MTVRPVLRVFAVASLAVCLLPFARSQTVAPLATAVPADQDFAHEGRWKRAIEADLVEEKFDELDRLADTYRREKTRGPGGEWVLHSFYEYLDSPQLTDKDSADHLEHLRHWMAARPESITARVALATSLHRWAWVARGNGFINTVSAENLKLFLDRSHEARIVLEGSRDMKTMCPQWYSQMFAVGVAEGWEPAQMKDIFERGVQFEPQYHYLYQAYASSILPKWYGQLGDSAVFAKRAADKMGGDAGDILYFRIATNLIKRGDGDFPVKQLDWGRIQRGYKLCNQQYGATRRHDNELAFMAYKYKDIEIAQMQFASIGDDWATAVWRDRKFFDRARDWANGHTAWP
jgi:hypothetical protein